MKSLDGKYPAGIALAAGVWSCLVALAMPSCATEQPTSRCQAAPGPFSMKYTLVSGTGDCAEIKGDIAGVHSYWRTGEDGVPTVTRGPVAIKTDEVGTLLKKYGRPGDSAMATAVGTFKTEKPDANGFCEVENMSPTTLKLAAVPSMPAGDAGMTDPLPPVELTLKWSDVKFYVTAAQPGTMFSGRLEYARTVTDQACTATFDVIGMYPAISCEGSAMVNGQSQPSGKPDDTLCDPCPDPTNGRLTGSGVHPAIDVSCDAETLSCIPRAAVPSLRPQQLICGGV
jgi:hypothetical protein